MGVSTTAIDWGSEMQATAYEHNSTAMEVVNFDSDSDEEIPELVLLPKGQAAKMATQRKFRTAWPSMPNLGQNVALHVVPDNEELAAAKGVESAETEKSKIAAFMATTKSVDPEKDLDEKEAEALLRQHGFTENRIAEIMEKCDTMVEARHACLEHYWAAGRRRLLHSQSDGFLLAKGKPRNNAVPQGMNGTITIRQLQYNYRQQQQMHQKLSSGVSGMKINHAPTPPRKMLSNKTPTGIAAAAAFVVVVVISAAVAAAAAVVVVVAVSSGSNSSRRISSSSGSC